MSKSSKRQRQLATKKARRATQYTPGKSKYARKERAQLDGHYSRRSPFHSATEEVTS